MSFQAHGYLIVSHRRLKREYVLKFCERVLRIR